MDVWENGELLDSHLFFFHCYSDLADDHRMKGRTVTADKLAAIAEGHYQRRLALARPPLRWVLYGRYWVTRIGCQSLTEPCCRPTIFGSVYYPRSPNYRMGRFVVLLHDSSSKDCGRREQNERHVPLLAKHECKIHLYPHSHGYAVLQHRLEPPQLRGIHGGIIQPMHGIE